MRERDPKFCHHCGERVLRLDERVTRYEADSGRPYDAGHVRYVCSGIIHERYSGAHHDETVLWEEGMDQHFDTIQRESVPAWLSRHGSDIMAVMFILGIILVFVVAYSIESMG